jgi:acyl-coenzyme A synthetase/AMP-(fatty) acid ligase
MSQNLESFWHEMKSHPMEALYKKFLPGPPHPDREFILSGATYGDVYELAGGIKNRLPGDGAGTVCLCTEDRTLILAALIASLTGGPQFIIPHAFSKQILRDVMDSSSLAAILTDHPITAPADIPVLTASSCGRARLTMDAPRNPDETFLQLFTGGTTGKQKLWSKTPRNLFAEASYLLQRFNISDADLFAATVPPHHIYGLLFSVILPFLSAATTLAGMLIFPGEIAAALEKDRATILISVPIHYRALASYDLSRHRLRLAFSSAGMLDKKDAETFYRTTGLGVTEVYGSTETGGIATRCRADGDTLWTPFTAADWKIIRKRLAVRSDLLSPDLRRDDDGFFMTGDLAESSGNGQFNLLGRADGVVKVAGRRVDLNEVQDKLKQLPGVQDAAVLALPVQRGRQNDIVAFVVTGSDVRQIRRQASETLSPYAVPRHICSIDQIPVTPAGKQDRQRLERIIRERIAGSPVAGPDDE